MQESPLLGFWQGKEIEASGVSVVLLLTVCAMIFCGTATVLVHGGGTWVGYSFPQQGKVCHAATAFSSVVPNTCEGVHIVSPLPELIKQFPSLSWKSAPKDPPRLCLYTWGHSQQPVREMCG